MSVKSLAREIGWTTHCWGDDTALLCAWTKLLADIVARHTAPGIHSYGAKLIAWASEIAGVPDAGLAACCDDVRSKIKAIDCHDGWPVDRAGNALNAVCLSATIGIIDQEHSRWPAEASAQVWAFATGARHYNDIVSISRSAWQRHLFSQAIALGREK